MGCLISILQLEFYTNDLALPVTFKNLIFLKKFSNFSYFYPLSIYLPFGFFILNELSFFGFTFSLSFLQFLFLLFCYLRILVFLFWDCWRSSCRSRCFFSNFDLVCHGTLLSKTNVYLLITHLSIKLSTFYPLFSILCFNPLIISHSNDLHRKYLL